MAPTIVRDGQFGLFFFSREETRIHVHVSHVDGEAKFWLTPHVALANLPVFLLRNFGRRTRL